MTANLRIQPKEIHYFSHDYESSYGREDIINKAKEYAKSFRLSTNDPEVEIILYIQGENKPISL